MYLFLHDYTIILCHQWCLSKNQPLVNKIWKESVVFFLFWIDMDSQHYCLLVGFKCVCVRMRGCGCMRVCVHVHPAHAVFWHHSTFTRILFLLSDIVKISCLCTVPCVNHILISSFLSPPPRMKGGGYWNHCVCPSICLSVCPIMSTQYLLNCSISFLPNLVWWWIITKAICQAEKLVHHLECQGHSKGLYNQNMTFFLLYRLNYWSVCNYTWFDRTAS